MRKVEVVPYDENWPNQYNEEAKRILNLNQSNIINIVHIGSTAIPNMAAKPVIDMLLIVRNLAKVDNTKLTSIGYECHGENGLADRIFFSKGGDNRSHHLHVFQFDNINEIQRHISLKEYLINNDERRQEYAEVKTLLAEKFPEDIESYIRGKNDLVKKIERESLIFTWKKI
ncbi:GrpB family protein [Enterococcus sp. HY326]|uniref:GrpB family protein n=1 Tax=Enterococcus sp. HY326 TaxID=2971265 RepID=UPI0022402261|nr:GrpB family protein [Enterococcus sp. HY326]